MPTFQTYNVTPILPATLEPLRELSFNLWWTWEPAARRLFRELDPELWNQTNHNPVRMLQLSRQSRLEELAQDNEFFAGNSNRSSRILRNISDARTRTERPGPPPRSTIRSPTFPPSSVFTNQFRITLAASAFWLAIIANRRAILI